MLNKSIICLKCQQKPEDDLYFTLSKCKHIICEECLCKHLEKFSSCNILCPLKGCSKLIADNIVRKCLSNVQLELYDAYCLPSTAVKCLIKECPGIVTSETNEGHFYCTLCEQPNCLTCKNLHHPNDKCEQSSNKKSFEETAANNLRERWRLELLQIRKDSSLSLNPEKSECLNCCTFLLPRHGIFVMPCMHNFCRACLREHLDGQKAIGLLACPSCSNPLENCECRELMNEETLQFLSIKAMQFRFYHCKTPDCTSFWDPGTFTGIHKCGICKKDNCISCRATHEGKSCIQYRKSAEYQKQLEIEECERNQKWITCYNCGYSFIQDEGCGALQCDNCFKQVCAFSGKQLGPNGCQCRSSKRCHPGCVIGCRPEGKGKEIDELNDYFNNN